MFRCPVFSKKLQGINRNHKVGPNNGENSWHRLSLLKEAQILGLLDTDIKSSVIKVLRELKESGKENEEDDVWTKFKY